MKSLTFAAIATASAALLLPAANRALLAYFTRPVLLRSNPLIFRYLFSSPGQPHLSARCLQCATGWVDLSISYHSPSRPLPSTARAGAPLAGLFNIL